MHKQLFNANWVTTQTDDLHFPLPLSKVFHAVTQPISFTYPFSWNEAINVFPQYGNLPKGAEFGFVTTAGWQVGPTSPMGIWFFVGSVAMPKACYQEVKLVSVVSSSAAPLAGLLQPTYYCETVTSPTYDTSRYIANFGLLSVHTGTTSGRFSVKEYLACHPSADNWFVYDKTTPQSALFQFGGHTFGLIPTESSQAFNSKQEAVDFFATADYQKAKTIIQSTYIS